EQYDVQRHQSEAVRAVSSFGDYIMSHNRAKAWGPATTDPLWPIVELRLGVQPQPLHYDP
ncbi:hypothetical protein HAX54_029870, partial [Datura stramonium]|nr:hypothetical protein [Datura stramonium]